MLDSTEGTHQAAPPLEPRLARARSVTMPAFFRMRATRHMDQVRDYPRIDCGGLRQEKPRTGRSIPRHQQFECSVDDVKDSATVSYPLNLYECCPVTDGACAVLVTNDERAREFTVP